MEHPYLFLVKVFEWFGPGAAHFAHAYPYIQRAQPAKRAQRRHTWNNSS